LKKVSEMIDQFTKTGKEITIYINDQSITISRAEFEDWWEQGCEEDFCSWTEFWDGEPEDIHEMLEAYLIFKHGAAVFDGIRRGAVLSDFDE
jgi:hypothetical protein